MYSPNPALGGSRPGDAWVAEVATDLDACREAAVVSGGDDVNDVLTEALRRLGTTVPGSPAYNQAASILAWDQAVRGSEQRTHEPTVDFGTEYRPLVSTGVLTRIAGRARSRVVAAVAVGATVVVGAFGLMRGMIDNNLTPERMVPPGQGQMGSIQLSEDSIQQMGAAPRSGSTPKPTAEPVQTKPPRMQRPVVPTAESLAVPVDSSAGATPSPTPTPSVMSTPPVASPSPSTIPTTPDALTPTTTTDPVAATPSRTPSVVSSPVAENQLSFN